METEFHKYPKIHLIGHKENELIFSNPEDMIYIEEKIDGGNFRWMIKDNEIIFGSHSRELDGNQEKEKSWISCIRYIKDTLNGKDLNGFQNYIFYGECLSGDTIIFKSSCGRGNNGNRMTLKQMYNYLHTNEPNRNTSWWQRYGMPKILSLNFKSKKLDYSTRIVDIIYSGKKRVYLLKTRLGFSIKASLNHQFLTPHGYKQLKDLVLNDVIAVSNVTNLNKKRNLGVGSRKIIKEQKLYKEAKKRCELCNSTILLELHHKDNNPFNNNIKNWRLLCRKCHSLFNNYYDKGRIYNYYFDNIISIKNQGIEDVYDIQMNTNQDNANYLANGFIVHNCCIRHSISYDWNKIPRWIGFDIMDLRTNKFVDYDLKLLILGNLGFQPVPLVAVLAAKEIKKIDDSSVPQSRFYEGKSEGLVYKNYSKQVFGKYVTSKFREVNKEVFGKTKRQADNDDERIVAIYCTNARIDKLIFKLVNDGYPLEMKLMNTLPKMVLDDIYAENWSDILNGNYKIDTRNIKKLVSKRCLEVLKTVIVNNSLNLGANDGN